MPLYEYYCPKCEQEFELLVRGSEKAVCPHCENSKIVRQMSAPATHVKSSETPGCGPLAPRGGCGQGPACAGCPMH